MLWLMGLCGLEALTEAKGKKERPYEVPELDISSCFDGHDPVCRASCRLRQKWFWGNRLKLIK